MTSNTKITNLVGSTIEVDFSGSLVVFETQTAGNKHYSTIALTLDRARKLRDFLNQLPLENKIPDQEPTI